MRLITVAIHTCDHALRLKGELEREGIEVVLQNVNLDSPVVSSGMRVRIHEHDLPLALRIIENPEVFKREDETATMEYGREILVPVDFSAHSFNAALAAVRIAKKHGADIRLLHSYIDPLVAGKMQLSDSLTFELSDDVARARIAADANARMQKMADDLREMMRNGRLPAVKVDTAVSEGVPEDSIVSYVKNHLPLLVVMGTRSFDKKERDMIGSVSAEVLDSCRLSVLVIPETADVNDLPNRMRVLYFANLDQEDMLAYDTFGRIFPDVYTETTVVNIPAKRRILDRMRSESVDSLAGYFRKNYPDSKFETAEIGTVDAIDDFDRLQLQHTYDLLVIPNKRKNLFSRVFNPGLAHRLLFHANIPMLVIPV